MAAEQLKVIDASGALVRAMVLLLTALALFGSWRALRWYTGSEIALAAPQLPESGLSAAQTASRLAPADPLAHRNLAALMQREDVAAQPQALVAEYSAAVGLSPHDFRLWTDLGRAFEQAGDFESGERALRRAVELAPYYSWPRWHLGNFLLRRGRYEEGLAELKRVAEVDPTKRGAVFDAAWMVYGGDIRAVKNMLGDSPAVRADFINYLLNRKHLDDALEIWSGFTAEQKTENAEVGKTLVNNLIEAKRFRAAQTLSRELAGGKGVAEVGHVWNGGFESSVTLDGAALFDWRIQNVAQARVNLDTVDAREGKRSLRINFNAPETVDFNFAQLVALEPATSYRLSFYVRTSGLKSVATTVVRVANAADGKQIAESAPAPAGKTEWQQVFIDFKMPPDADAVSISIGRAKCVAEGGVCPIFGTVWYDDFNLQLAGREAGAPRASAGK